MTQQPRRKIPNWPSLPPELLAEISYHLNSPANIKNFRATCKNFRSSTPPPPLQLSPTFPAKYSFPDGAPFTVIPTTVFLLRVPAAPDTVSWLVAVEEVNTGMLRMIDPFTKLPVDSPGNLSGFESVEVSKGFALRSEDGNIPVLEHENSFSPKVLVWHNAGGRYLMLLHSTEVLESVSLQSGETNYISHEDVSSFDDIICRDDAVLAVDRDGILYTVAYSLSNNLDIPHFNYIAMTTLVDIEPHVPMDSFTRKRLLLDSNGDLYLIVRETVYVDCKFRVFRLTYKVPEWVEVVSLGNRVLFVTADNCFFVWATDLRVSGIRGNCIVFPKGCFPDEHGLSLADETLFQCASERGAVGVCRYGEGPDFTLISSLRGFSDLLRPFSSCILNGTLRYLRVSANDKDDEKQKVQTQCVTDASSRACLIKDSAASADNDDDFVDEVGTEIQDHYGHEINFAFETQADMSDNLVIVCALEARPKKASAQINVKEDQYSTERRWIRGIISVEEAHHGDPPRIRSYSNTRAVINPEAGKTNHAWSFTTD